MEDFYRKFGEYYDQIYATFYKYKKECDNLEMIFSRHSKKSPKDILDLGCGTGTHAIELTKRGYKCTGIDISPVMIGEAKKKAEGENLEINFELQDMRDLSLPDKFDAATCLFGGFGYLLSQEDLNGFFGGIGERLKEPSLLVFEYWNVRSVQPGLRSWVRVEDEDRKTTIIRLSESKFNKENSIISLDMDFFVFGEKELIDRFTEVHELRCHDPGEIESILEKNSFELIAAYGKDVKTQELDDEIGDAFNVLVVAKAL